MSSCEIERAKSKYVMGYKAPMLLCSYIMHIFIINIQKYELWMQN